MEKMKLNNIERIVNDCEPTNVFPGIYNVDANYSRALNQIKIDRLFEILNNEGLVYSGVNYEVQYGFNDKKVMGIKEADAAKKEGKSYVWIGLDGKVVNLEVLPKTIEKLKDETHFQYAQRILDKVVTFVESPENYKK